MKWKVAVGALGIMLGIFSSLWPQEKQAITQQEKTGGQAAAPAPKAHVEWQKLSPGVRALRLWTMTAPQYPQIVVLKLSNDEYVNFKKDPSAFVNSHHVFPKDVQPGATNTEVEAPPAGYKGVWSAVCVHTMQSTMAALSSTAEEQKSVPK